MRALLRGLLLLLAALAAAPALACPGPATICPRAGALALVESGHPAAILADPADDAGVLRAAASLRGDLDEVGGGTRGPVRIIVGTIGRSPTIDRLIRERRLDVAGVAGRWEAYVWQVVDRPAPGIARAGDRRR
jgi:hypothetical protein